MATPTPAPSPTMDPNNPNFSSVAQSTATAKPTSTPTLPAAVNPAGGLPGATSTSTSGGINSSTVPVSALAPATNAAGQAITYKDLIQIPPATSSSTWTTGYYDPTTRSTIWAAAYVDAQTGNIQVTTDQAGYHKAFLQSLVAKYGSIAKVKSAFASVAGGLGGTANKAKASLAAGNTEDPTLSATIDAAIGNISRTIVYSDGQTAPTVAAYIDGRPNYAGDRNTVTVTHTTKDSAYVDLDKFMMENLSRHATTAEFNTYYQALTAFENDPAHAYRAVVTTDGLGIERSRVETSAPTAEDKLAVLVGSVSQSLMAAGKDPHAISQLGGKLGDNFLQIQQRAIQQGVSDYFDTGKVFASAVNSIQQGNTLSGELAKVDSLAISLPKYKALAPSLSAGFTMQDLAKPFNDKINSILETSNPVDVNNPLIQKALTGGANGAQMNDDQFTQLVRSQPNWRYTQNARETASQYIDQIGKMMGFSA